MPIRECGEALLPIPPGLFILTDPPPYMAFGAPYSGASPWMLRKSVLDALTRAQTRLGELKPGWKILIFDAYRPNAVQVFMVEREYALQAKAAGLDPAALTDAEREKLTSKVLRIWGIPSEDPAAPPLHSTGGAVDITLADETGREVDMGGAIDENSDRSNPDHYAGAQDKAGRRFHANRELLNHIMTSEDFCRMRDEWWHFSKHDQYWAWRERETGRDPAAVALYGRADLV
jgi:D-alanyl-D-alanine dipeptidase